MLVGYARTSTLDQKAGLEAQHRDLADACCEKVFTEQVSSVDVAARDQLAAALDFVREGDVLIVTKLDRLARSVPHLLQITETLERKGVALRILNMAMDTSTPTGRLLLTTLAAIGAWEREVMLERQREGIEKARREGRYKGRPATINPNDVRALKAEGLGASAIAKRLGIGRASVYRALEGCPA